MPKGAVAEDLRGQRFGRLTAIERGPNKGHNTTWKCFCTCGTYKVVRTAALKSGNTRSCGCLRSENMRRYHVEKKLVENKRW